MATTKTTPCACQKFEFGTFEIEQDDDYNTGCKQDTARTFAMGHDAKLVGYLVRAELAGEEIRMNNGGVVHSFQGAVHAASTISEALAAKAEAQLDAAKARLAKKAAREAAKAARGSKKAERKLAEQAGLVEAPAAPTTREAKIKVGRWTYDAVIDIASGEATYTPRFGGPRTMLQGKYTEIN
jgi:hypothetical protein